MMSRLVQKPISRRLAIVMGLGSMASLIDCARKTKGTSEVRKAEVMGTRTSVVLVDLNRYESELLPAYLAFMERSLTEPLQDLLERSFSAIDSMDQGRFTLSVEVYREYADILAGRVYYSSIGDYEHSKRKTSPDDLRLFVRESIAPAVLWLRCVPHDAGFPALQCVSDDSLTDYLYERSRWIHDHFTFAREPSGPTPVIRLGDWGRLFSRDEVEIFNRELIGMQRPTDPKVEGFDNLCGIVRKAALNLSLGLLLSVL